MLYKAIKALIIFVSCFILVTPSFAAYISVTPTEFNLNLNPSQFYNGTININNTCQDQLQINISSELEGTYSGNEAGISLDDNNFTLNPGETKKVRKKSRTKT